MKIANYTVPFIVSLIQNKEKISESRFYKADLSSSDLLMDLEIILENLKLTDKQRYVLNNCWINGYTQFEIAQKLGVTQQMVEKQCKAIKKKIHKELTRQGEI